MTIFLSLKSSNGIGSTPLISAILAYIELRTRMSLALDGSQIRPYVIFFNENLQYSVWKSAVQAIREADMMIIVGCSLKVFPAAEMVEELREEASLVVIDPADSPFPIKRTYAHLKLPASKGMKILEDTLLKQTMQ